ncbi:MAG: Na+/H+ antiporter subunit C [Desulfobacteraceae bacterium]|nr:Na+/H+ antiporter subunit C [Desulfobacteraceae bacterium]MBC2749540.1 Na+/H+ antiporter subunit C [Desulfobacteraceae bacterium]
METALAIVSGSMVAGGIYLLLSQNLVRILFGLIMLSNAVNLVIFTAGGLTHTKPALIEVGRSVPGTAVANALPQALILTAIVIGFALLVFMFVLFYRSYESLGTIDTRQMTKSAPEKPHATDTTTARQEAGS